MGGHSRRWLGALLACLPLVARAQAERVLPLNACFGPDDEAAFYFPLAPSVPFVGPPPPPAVEFGSRDVKKVALTFDACSDKEPNHFDEAVYRVLVETATPATIFVGGRWAEDRADVLALLVANPLVEIANHSYFHPHLPQESWERIRREIERSQKVLTEKTGKAPQFFRAPFVEIDERVRSVAVAHGLTVIQNDVASGDPDANVTKEAMVKWVLHRVKNGSIVVMHINQRGVHTGEALPEIIAGLREKGFELVTVGALLAEPEPPNLAITK